MHPLVAEEPNPKKKKKKKKEEKKKNKTNNQSQDLYSFFPNYFKNYHSIAINI